MENNKQDKDTRTELDKLAEMVEAMEESLENLSKICEQQALLISVVQKANEPELQAFVNESIEQLENLKRQKSELKEKVSTYHKILEIDDKQIINVLNVLLKILGVFKNR